MDLEQAQTFLEFLVRTSFADRIEIDWPHHRAYAEMPILLPKELGGDGKACLEYGRCNFVTVEETSSTAQAAAERAGTGFRMELWRLHDEEGAKGKGTPCPHFAPGDVGAIIWRARPKVRRNDNGTFTASLRFGLMGERFVKHGIIPAE